MILELHQWVWEINQQIIDLQELQAKEKAYKYNLLEINYLNKDIDLKGLEDLSILRPQGIVNKSNNL